MRGFVLTSAVCKGTPYERDIVPITWPRMERYAEIWEMEWRPLYCDPGDLLEFDGSPAPHGTGTDYWSIQYRREFLEHNSGVVFIDADCLILDPTYDISREVNDNVPLAFTVHTVNGEGSFPNWGVVAMRNHVQTKALLDGILDLQDIYRSHPWLEQGAAMQLMGWTPSWPTCTLDNQPNLPINQLSTRWNSTPHDPYEGEMGHPLIYHPSGVWPFSDRLEKIQRKAKLYPLTNTRGWKEKNK